MLLFMVASCKIELLAAQEIIYVIFFSPKTTKSWLGLLKHLIKFFIWMKPELKPLLNAMSSLHSGKDVNGT